MKGTAQVYPDVQAPNGTPSPKVEEETTSSGCGKFCGVPKYWAGVGVVILVILLWVGSSFLTKTIMKGFQKPFFLTYLCLISLQVFYIFLLVKDPIFEEHLRERKTMSLNTLGKEISKSSPTVMGRSPVFVGVDATEHHLPPATNREIAKYGCILFIFYAVASYLSNLSYRYTSVSSSTIMATTNGIFLLLFGLAFNTDRANMIKLLAATISTVGAITLVVMEIKPFGNDRLIGNMMSFAGSALFSLHSVIFKKTSTDPGRVHEPLLFATVGTYSMIFLWPVFLILHYTGYETFLWPEDLASWASILFNVIFGTLVPTYLWTIAFLLTSPLVVAIGISMTVPLTLIFEVAYSNEMRISSLISGALVVGGFLLINTRSFCNKQST